MHGGYVLGIVVVGVAGSCIQGVLDIGAGDWRGLVVISSGENPEPSILVVFFFLLLGVPVCRVSCRDAWCVSRVHDRSA